MTDSTPQGREKGAGERARELAEKAARVRLQRASPTAVKRAFDLDVLIEALATSAREATGYGRKRA
jgi:hypothetical protein